MSNELGKDSVRFDCKCGYKTKLPAKFNGKKVICPKCFEVMRAKDGKKAASFMVCCPYCSMSQEFQSESNRCVYCKSAFEIPTLPGAQDSRPVNTIQTTNSECNVFQKSPDVITLNPPRINVRNTRTAGKRSNSGYPIFGLLINLLLPIGLTALIWYSFGDKLGLPPLPFLQKTKDAVEKRAEPTKSVPIAPIRRTHPSKKTKTLAPPQLQSPSLAISSVSHSIEEHNESEDEDLNQPKKTLILEMELKNLTKCTILRANFLIHLKSRGDMEQNEKLFHEFEGGLLPESGATVYLKTKHEDWESASVTIHNVTTGNQSDATSIGPYVVFDSKND